MLHAGLRCAERSGDADRPERGRQAAGSGDAAGLGHGAAGHIHHGGDVGGHVRSGAVDHRHSQPRCGGGVAGHGGAADRGVLRAAVRRGHRVRRSVSGSGQLSAQLRAELRQHVGRAHHTDGAPHRAAGSAWRVDRHVRGAVLPGTAVPVLPVAAVLAAQGAADTGGRGEMT